MEAGVLNTADLDGWLRGGKSPKWKIVACGLPAYCTLHTLLESAKSNSAGILLSKWLHIFILMSSLFNCILSWTCFISCNKLKFAAFCCCDKICNSCVLEYNYNFRLHISKYISFVPCGSRPGRTLDLNGRCTICAGIHNG